MMSKVRRVALLSIVPVLGLVAAASADPPAVLETFSRPSGETFYALTLDPPADLQADVPQDVVVLFDTSAGQTSLFREMGMAALEELLGSLNEQSRVKLLAVDLRAVELQDGFAVPRSAEVQAALAQLKSRAPLGSTDMEAVLSAAADAFPQDANRPRSAVYIGGGTSTINLLSAERLAGLLDQLRERQVDVSSYALGVRTDAPLLAAIANQTGGNLYVAETPALADDAQGITAERATQENVARGRQTGRLLAQWAEVEVLWPAESQTAPAIDSHLPNAMPPLRADRATVLVGKAPQPLDQPATVTVTSTDGRRVEWNARPQTSNPDHAYLAPLVESAEPNAGVLMPTIGREGLAEARRLVHQQVEGLATLANQAVSAGDAATADRIAQAVLQYDPGNPRAVAARNVAARQMAQGGAGQMGQGGAAGGAPPASGEELTLLRMAQREDRGPVDPANIEPVPGAYLEDVLGEQAVIRDLIRSQVQESLDEARRIMSDQPAVAIQDLKLAIEYVQRAPELDPDVRRQLVDRLEVALREAERRAVILEDIRREEIMEQAAAQAQLELNERIMRAILKKDQLMSRFTALMQEENYEAAIEVAGFVDELAPGEVVPRAATYDARLVMNEHRGQVARSMRHSEYIDTLHQVELSAIPFPDDPPIVYPPAEVWQALTDRRLDRYSAVDLKGQEPAQQEITEALDDLTTLDLFDVPLEEAVDTIERLHNIPIELDDRALLDVGVDTSSPVTANYQNMSLRSALRLMLRDLELTYIIEDEYLLITTEEEAELRLTTKVYPVADLVLPIIVIPTGIGGGGLGGGLGGGGLGGGGGGGFGGGGLGGGGLGGGGFGGGGFFAVPDAPLDSSAEESSTPVRAKQEQPASEPVAASSQPSRSESTAVIEFDASADPEAFWNEYFAANRPPLESVRATVRRQMETGKTPHVIALIQAALRNGQPQPWMYEALGIAMELESHPKEEIERAILSAVDFARGPEDLMQIARFLSHIGLDQRALDLYRQVVKIDSLAADSYLFGLRAAQRADSLDGIRWATVGLLSQAWTAEQAEAKQVAFRVAKATLDRLREEGRHEEMADYQRELDEAMVRDCVIKVSWTGDADIDLLVEEPSGTVCSIHNPRTTAGGVNLGDTYAHFDKDAPGSFSEVYVCPKAFAGEYRARVRKVWGNVTAGKATVEVWTNYRTESVQYERQQVDVGRDDALVKFELQNGRRAEPLAAAQLANAVQQQVHVNRSVLAQQMQGLLDPRAGLRPNEGSLGGAVGIGPDGQPILLRRGGAVGYQPQIITLPQGTMLFVTGVVSADRRYVRITASPSFTAIGDVTTFTFAGAGQPIDMDMDMGDQDGEDEDVIDAGGN